MKTLIFAVFLLLTSGPETGNAMELNTAIKLIHAWGQHSQDMTFISQIAVDPHGGILTKSAGAVFRYDAAQKRLFVSGVVSYDDTLHTEFPDTWEQLVRASKREWATCGEGEMELYKKKLFQLNPNVILLTKSFQKDEIKPEQFVRETQWLLSAAYYWSMKRYNQVLVSSEADLIRQGPAINAEMLKARPRPW